MRIYSLFFVAIVSMATTASEAQTDTVTVLDVTKICRGIASQSTDPMANNYPMVSFEQCMQDEKEDRQQLVKEWSSFSSEDKRHCVTLAKTGDEPSYTELITCLEMARDVRELRQSMPRSGARTK